MKYGLEHLAIYKRWLAYILLFIAVYFSFFHFIHKSPIFIWDEASYAINAIEMTLNNKFLVLHYDGEPTLYNTKPPFVIWMQSLFMRVFGMNELSVRLPSALSALAVVISLLYFSKKVLNNPVIGIIASVTLIGAMGYVKPHVVRSGDLDAMLAMWITFYTLTYFSLLLSNNINVSKHIILTCIGVLFAFLTKSVAGFIPILGLLIITLFSEKRKLVFTNIYTYTGSLSVLLICVSYYYYRDLYAIGYWDKVFYSEYTRIYANIMQRHTQPHFFYLEILNSVNHFIPHVYFLPTAFFLGLFSNEKKIQKLTLYLSIWCITYFAVISYPPNKLSWYNAPQFPMFCLLIAIFIYEVFKNIDRIITGKYINTAFKILLCISLFIYPYYRVVKRNFQEHIEVKKLEREGFYVRHLTKNYPHINNYTILMETNSIHNADVAKFYMKASNYEHKKNIDLRKYLSEIRTADTILICQKNKLDSLKNNYNYLVLNEFKNCELIQLK